MPCDDAHPQENRLADRGGLGCRHGVRSQTKSNDDSVELMSGGR